MLKFFLLKLIIIVVTSTNNVEENIIQKFKLYTNDFQKDVNPILLTDLFVKFQEEYNLLGVLVNDGKELYEHVRKIKEDINEGDIKKLYSYFVKHDEYLEKVRSRNELVYFIKKNPFSIGLERMKLLDIFFQSHEHLTSNVQNFEKFKQFMRGIDYRIDISILRILYPHVFEYEQYLNRRPLYLKITRLVGETTKKTNDIKSDMDRFITGYKMTGKDVSQLRTFRQLFYAVDFASSDSETRNLHPIVRKYSSVTEMQDKRQKLNAKINSVIGVKSHEIKLEALQLLSVYKLIDTDITNPEIFKNEITRKDDSIEKDSEELNTLHLHVVEYVKYAYKIEVRKMLLHLISKNVDLSIFEMSNVMESFIASYNLFDFTTITDARKLRDQMFNQDAITSEQEAIVIFSYYEKYTQYMDLELAKDCVLSLIHNYPREKVSRFEAPMDRMLRSYKIYQYGVSRMENFRNYMKEMNPLISDNEIITLHPIVIKFLDYKRKKSAYDDLSNCIQSLDAVKPNLGDLSKKAINILSLKKNHLTDYEKFKLAVSGIYIQPNYDHMRMVYDQLVRYESFAEQNDDSTALNPGGINIDGSIVPPNSGIRLFWYNLFKTFGAIPHIVNDVGRFEDLSNFQRWFDNFYYQCTGIHYYVFDPLLKFGLKNAVKPTSTNQVIKPARALSQ